MIKLTTKGNFNNIEKFLKRANKLRVEKILARYGSIGVSRLAEATPVDSGETSASWSYEITQTNGAYNLIFTNSHTNKGVNIAVLLQYGHGTGTGGYVAGTDFINPALRPVFNEIANAVWKEVTL